MQESKALREMIELRVHQSLREPIFKREELFAGVRPRLLRLARLRGVAPDTLEDVVQETLLVAWRLLDRLQTPEHFHLWIDEICRKICSRALRASSRDTSRYTSLFFTSPDGEQDELDELFPAINTLADSLDPLEELSRSELTELLRRALDLLPEKAREAIEFYYLLELPQREAALQLGLSISALETRLHRARHQLRQILNGDLRTEAVSLDLPLDEEPSLGWRATGVWCYYCGQQRLHGSFEVLPDGHRSLRMRCPGCSQRYGADVVNGKGLVQVDGLHTFQPAFKRTLRGVSKYLLQAVAMGEISCLHCGKSVPTSVLASPKEGSSMQRKFWIGGFCPHCGDKTGGFSADDAVYWSNPTVQEFIRRYPRWFNEPDRAIEYNGQPAILFRLADRMGTARLNVITHRQTLQVLATFQE